MTDRELDFKKIHDTYWQRIRLYLEKLVGEGESEDLTQEVFTRVSRSLHTFQGKSRLSTWIFQIATNVAMDRIRKRNRSGEELSLDIVEGKEDRDIWREEIRTLDQQVIRKEMNDCIRNVILKLPEVYRTVVVLSELEGFKGEEMAEILGLSLEAVKIRLHRARAKLREELSKQCILYRDEWNELACELKGFEIDDVNKDRSKFL